jgi:hypothetical protein
MGDERGGAADIAPVGRRHIEQNSACDSEGTTH